MELFLFGDTDSTLELVKYSNKNLRIVGVYNGFVYSNNDLIEQINSKSPDILIVGLGCPKQERWISENKTKVNVKILLAVGDGIKVFAGTKIRGHLLFRKLGLEWFVRLINHPLLYWMRYIIGIPLFIFRVLKYKNHISG